MTARWRSRLKIRVTLTLMPSAMAAVIASRPSTVAGILIMAFGRSTFAHSCLACVDGAGGVVGEARLDLDRDAAVLAAGRVVDRPEDVAARRRRRAVVISKTASVTLVPGAASSATCVVVGLPLASAVAKIVGLVVTPTTFCSSMSFCEPARRDALAREVVEPDADADVGELPAVGLVMVLFFLRADGQLARGGDRLLGGGDGRLGGDAELAEQGLVVGRGAEVLDRHAAAGVADVGRPGRGASPASIETRAFTAAGSTDSRYAASCSSNHSWHGTETTRALMPSPFSTSRASTAICTSEPVAIRITSGVPPGASASTYAPFATFVAEAKVSPDGFAVAALEHRQVLAAERDAGGAVAALEDRLPGLGDLVRVGGAHDVEARDRAERA